MAFGHGKRQYFQLDNSAGALQNLSAYLTDISHPKTIDNADVSTITKNSKVYVVGLEDNKISLTGKYDPTVDGIIQGTIAALKAGTLTTATYEYGPQGSTAGKPKITGECIVASYEISGGVGDAVGFSLELQVSDDVTVTTF